MAQRHRLLEQQYQQMKELDFKQLANLHKYGKA